MCLFSGIAGNFPEFSRFLFMDRPSRAFCVAAAWVSVCLAIAGWSIAGASKAQAQTRIGAATAVKNQVVTLRRGQSIRLGQGSSVFRSEVVSTGRDSAARLTFLDETNLSIGPSSRVVLDEFVYSTSRSAQALTINLARGAFRFSTGKLDKRAYKIRTSTTTIGVRGTILDIFSQFGKTFVTLVDNGAAFLCVTGKAICATLNVRGQTFVIDRFGINRVTGRTTRYTFRRYCTGNLCKRTRLANRTRPSQRPIAPVITRIVQRRINQTSLCSNGDCTPVTVTQVSPTVGLVTGIVRFPGGAADWFSLGLTLPSTTNAPLVNGDIVSALPESKGANIYTFTAAGNVTATLVVDPGFKYTAWGEWNGNLTGIVDAGPGTPPGAPSEPVTRGFALFGNPTSADVIAARTGTATYSGPVLADFSPKVGGGFGPTVPGAIGGTVTITANFDTNTVSGGLNLAMSGDPWAAPVFASLPITTHAISGQNVMFAGAFSNPSAAGAGSVEAVFMGPAGEEVAGRFEYLKTTGSATDGLASGIVRGKLGGT